MKQMFSAYQWRAESVFSSPFLLLYTIPLNIVNKKSRMLSAALQRTDVGDLKLLSKQPAHTRQFLQILNRQDKKATEKAASFTKEKQVQMV